eukprot:COSAG02_NODE_40016_length_410_cov_0.659164_1_plen_102_part_01
MAVRDDGMVPVLAAEDLAGLPSSGGPWQDLPLASFQMGTAKQLALAAKRLVGMARAPRSPSPMPKRARTGVLSNIPAAILFIGQCYWFWNSMCSVQLMIDTP